MSAGRIVTGAQVRADVEERPDVCVIGSGAGGAVVAARLAQQGASVVVLEAGGHFTSADFDMQEATAYPRLYQEGGARATADLAITVLQGRAVGGTTVVNWTTSFRTPDRTLRHWAEVHGIEGLDSATLAPHFDAVERRLSIAEWPLEKVNANNRALWDGAGKLGLDREVIRRNVSGCNDLGYCGMGCPVDGKLSMNLTYVPDAVAAGAVLYANAKAVHLDRDGRRIAAVHAEVTDPATDRPTGRRIVVRPKLLVLAGGAINNPELLLRNELDFNGRVGRRTFIHPVVAMSGRYSHRIDGWYGAPQSVASHHFADRGPGKVGFFMETSPLHPMLAGTSLGGFGKPAEDVMAQLAHVSALIALSIDGFLPQEEGGTVTLRGDGRPRLDYPIRPEIWESLRESSKTLARVHLAAGAEEVYSLHEEPVVMRTEADVAKLDQAPWEPMRLAIFTAHCMGGCAMGRDPRTSVVDSKLKMHGLENVYVVDGSVFPTSLGVNPQETIFGIAHWAAEHIGAAIG